MPLYVVSGVPYLCTDGPHTDPTIVVPDDNGLSFLGDDAHFSMGVRKNPAAPAVADTPQHQSKSDVCGARIVIVNPAVNGVEHVTIVLDEECDVYAIEWVKVDNAQPMWGCSRKVIHSRYATLAKEGVGWPRVVNRKTEAMHTGTVLESVLITEHGVPYWERALPKNENDD